MGQQIETKTHLSWGKKWWPLLLPLIVMIGGGILIDLTPISGVFWLPVYLFSAFLAGTMGPFRSALLVTLVASVIVLVGTAIFAGDTSSSIGGRVPVLETLLIVTLPMVLFTWIGSRRRNREFDAIPVIQAIPSLDGGNDQRDRLETETTVDG
jgi:hypothetical protein